VSGRISSLTRGVIHRGYILRPFGRAFPSASPLISTEVLPNP
jgi:hypothetical protein